MPEGLRTFGTAMLCYVTPKEHLGLPNRKDVKGARWRTGSVDGARLSNQAKKPY